MTREEFIRNFLRADDAYLIGGIEYVNPDPNVRIVTSLIGSIYDLQQQIAELQEKIDEHKSN